MRGGRTEYSRRLRQMTSNSITPEYIGDTVDTALKRADEVVDILAGDQPRSWDTTMAPLDGIADALAKTFGETAFMGYVHDDPDVRQAGRAAEQRLGQWGVALMFRDDLYRAVKEYSDTEEAAQLEGERARAVEHTLRDLRRAGHELSAEAREELRTLSERLVELGVAFGANIDEDNKSLTVTPDDLEGLPPEYLESLEPGEEERTYRVTTAYPHVIPFMENARRRDLREKLSFLFNTRAMEENRGLLDEALDIRHRMAELFGRESWVDHQLEIQMAENSERVEEFYDSLLPKMTEKAKEEIAFLTELLGEDVGDDSLQVWDWRYYDTRQRESHGVDPNQIAEYFPLESVLTGMFDLTGEVFGIGYAPIEVETWHPEVRSYTISDTASGEEIAVFHMDLHPRQGTFGHAAAFPLVRTRLLPGGTRQVPTAAIVANFTRPTTGRPALLQHHEVETLFHEFGHILHQVLSRTELASFSGTEVERDFVEAPSQIMEHWTWQREILEGFARHYETGEPLPRELIEKMVAARRLNQALKTLRQMQYGRLDLELHRSRPGRDLDALVEEAERISGFPHHQGTFFPASFGHLLGGYDAGYYGYLWSEVYGDDMFSRFAEEGVRSPKVGADYRREILETGGSRDAMDHLRAFLGRDPENGAFLKKLGIDS